MLLRHDRDLGILATDIAHCTVMFCSLSNAGGRKAQTRLVSADVANFQRLREDDTTLIRPPYDSTNHNAI